MKRFVLLLALILAPVMSGRAAGYTFTWDANDVADSVLGYTLYEHVGTVYLPLPLMPVSPMANPTYFLPGLTRGTHYFVVTAFNTDGESDYSSEISILVKKKPNIVTGLKIISP